MAEFAKLHKTIPITVMFSGIKIGEATFFQIDEVTKSLASADFVLAGKYEIDQDGRIMLVSLSLIPADLQSKANLYEEANQHGNLKF